MNGWENFFLAQVGASAALAGLIFVSVSINLTKIIEHPRLPGRVFEAILALVIVLIVSSLMLIPAQALWQIGGETLIIGLAPWIMQIVLGIRNWRETPKQYRSKLALQICLGQIATIPFILSGLFFLFNEPGGFAWLVLAILASIIFALFDAWVLLVEINR